MTTSIANGFPDENGGNIYYLPIWSWSSEKGCTGISCIAVKLHAHSTSSTPVYDADANVGHMALYWGNILFVGYV